MPAITSHIKAKRIGISVKLTPDEHEALSRLVFAEGHSSFQGWFRSLAVERLRAAGVLPPQVPGNAA
jgi:hypothetical protein